MAGEPCVLCGHAPHANSSPNNPGGCSVIINEFRNTTCNCPEYRKGGTAPKMPKRHITMDTWPACSFGVDPHPIDRIEEEDDGQGNVTITATCCGRTDTLVVPKGARLKRGLLGLRVEGLEEPKAVVDAATTGKKPYPEKGPFATKSSKDSETEAPGELSKRFSLLEID